MVLKKATVQERLKFLQESLAKLDELKKTPHDQFFANFEKSWSAEHGLHLAAEAVFDIGNHILVGHFRENPKGYGEIVPRLAEKGVLTKGLASHFEKVGGFRNILVHEYMSVDKQKVYERLQKGLDDFRQFISEILRWMEPLEK